MITKTIIAVGLLGLTAFAQPALAQQSRSVAVADLDLSSPEGQSRLGYRIRAAARDVCAIDNGRTSLNQQIAADHCYRVALESTRTRVASAKSSNGRSR
jgi:UrcA family protein